MRGTCFASKISLWKDSLMHFAMKSFKLLAALALSFFLLPVLTFAQYTRTDLVTDATDANLARGWGLPRSGGSPFWVRDNVTGLSSLYNGPGQKFVLPTGKPLVVTIPPTPGSTATGTPTGTVFNITLGNPAPSFSLSSTASIPAIFLFATQDVTISAWNPAIDPISAAAASTASIEYHSAP